MSLLLQSAKIIDPNSPHHQEVKDILIKEGKITRIANNIKTPKGAETYDVKKRCVSPGWLDTYAFLGDPGYEHKEDLDSGCRAAARGGFTGVVCTPDTKPALHTKSEIEYVRKKVLTNLVDVWPLGAVTYDRQGKDITEMYDMRNAGAVGFSDGNRPVDRSGVLLRALQYVKPFEGVIFNMPNDTSISEDGVMNEGEVSTRLGLKGIPAMAEKLMVQRDIELLEYADSKLHFPGISTTEALELVRSAKKTGLSVTTAVAPYQLGLDESALNDYDTNYKVMPPLRTSNDKKALEKGLKDGTIDILCSNHQPQDEESKKVEFDYAEFGMTQLETALPLTFTYLKDTLSLETIVGKWAVRPYEILGLPAPSVEKNQKANLTLFDPEASWTYQRDTIRSRARNNPFIDRELQGKVLGVVNKGQWKIFDKTK